MMAFSNGSNLWIKGYFKECPSCKKKGWYKPRSMSMGHGRWMSYPMKCKYCGHTKGEQYEVDL